MSKADIIVEEIRGYQRQIDVLNAKISDTYKRLDKAYEEDRVESEQRRMQQYKNTIYKLWEIYWPEEDNSGYEKLQDLDILQLNMRLESDIKSCLKKTKLSPKHIESIREIVADGCPDNPNIDFDACVEDVRIRLDFASALRKVKNGTELSHKLGWGFAKKDLLNLMELHKKNKFRKKIEDLLEDCNFHSECSLLCSKDYEGFVAYVNGED